MTRFNSIIFYQNSLKLKLFLPKNTKFFSAGAPPPGPRASCGPAVGASPQVPRNGSPIADFLLRAYLQNTTF